MQVKPLLRGTLHQHAISASLAAGALLVATAHGRRAKLACAVYVASLAALFSASAAYHRPTWSVPARAVMRKLDHASIFLLIAGVVPGNAQHPCTISAAYLENLPTLP